MPYKFLIAGTHSGVGKTSITLALISHLKSLGFNILPYKIGPDFIDPGYHKIASGNPSINLDGWMLSKEYNINTFYTRFSSEQDIAVVEGVMGLYDGYSGISEKGSSAEMAKLLNLPVILVVDCKSMARSICAVIQGYKNFDKNVNLCGVILNNVGSEKHLKFLMEAVEKYTDVEIIGYFYKGDFPQIESRHLGLITVEDNKNFISKIREFQKVAAKRVDFEKLLKISKFKLKKKLDKSKSKIIKKIKGAVAYDNAFSFYYHDNLKILEKYGIKLEYFTPLRDNKLPKGIKFLYIGGGYPELYAKNLSENKNLINEIRNFIEDYNFVYAECGGFMFLTEGIYTDNGEFFPLVGIFKDRAIHKRRLTSLGYREIQFLEDSFLGKKGEVARGHEFHYSKLENEGKFLKKIYSIKNSGKSEGYIYKNCLGSYIHLHFGSNENLIKNLLNSI